MQLISDWQKQSARTTAEHRRAGTSIVVGTVPGAVCFCPSASAQVSALAHENEGELKRLVGVLPNWFSDSCTAFNLMPMPFEFAQPSSHGAAKRVQTAARGLTWLRVSREFDDW